MMLVFARPPQISPVRAGRINPISTDHRAVEIEMTAPGYPRLGQRRRRSRCLGGQHIDAFARVVVGGAHADPVIGGKLTTRAPSRNHRKTNTARVKVPNARRPLRVPTSTRRATNNMDKNSTVSELHLKHSSICDTEQHVKPLVIEVNLPQDHF
jgi:hypothetical protein